MKFKASHVAHMSRKFFFKDCSTDGRKRSMRGINPHFLPSKHSVSFVSGEDLLIPACSFSSKEYSV